jgi:hypothetical protein
LIPGFSPHFPIVSKSGTKDLYDLQWYVDFR